MQSCFRTDWAISRSKMQTMEDLYALPLEIGNDRTVSAPWTVDNFVQFAQCQNVTQLSDIVLLEGIWNHLQESGDNAQFRLGVSISSRANNANCEWQREQSKRFKFIWAFDFDLNSIRTVGLYFPGSINLYSEERGYFFDKMWKL
jgi:hypothetical protein